MPAEKQDSSKYRGGLSQPLAELFADPLSEVTRKRQTGLLVAASLVLLLSTGLARISEYSAGDTKLLLAAPRYVGWIVFAVTAYFLVTYLLGVWADFSIAGIKQWSPKLAIQAVEQAMDLDQKIRIAANQPRINKIGELNSQVGVILAEQAAALKPIDDKMSEMVATKPNQSATVEFYRLAEEYQATQSRFQSQLDGIFAEMKIEQNQLPGLNPWFTMLEDKGYIEKVLSKFSRLTRLRIFFEVMFPTAYATLALGLFFLHPWSVQSDFNGTGIPFF